MQVKVTVDATPEELRKFFGLPDVEPLQQELLDRARQMLVEGRGGVDPLAVMKPFLAPNMQGFEAMQRAFFDALASAAPRREPAPEKDGG